jgi:hypothetical protein
MLKAGSNIDGFARSPTETIATLVNSCGHQLRLERVLKMRLAHDHGNHGVFETDSVHVSVESARGGN